MIQQRWLALLCLIPLMLAGCDQVPWPNAASEDADEVPAVSEADGSGADVGVGSESEPVGSDEEGEEASADDEIGEGDEVPSEDEDGSAANEAGEPLTGAAPPLAASNAAAGLFDMLSEGEAERAAALVMASDGVKAFTAPAEPRMGAGSPGEVSALADRPSYRVLYTQRHADKYAEKREAEVAIYRYDTGEVSLSKVDLESGAVEALAVPEGFPIPLVPEEIQEASVIARANDEVKTALEDAGLDPESAVANGLLTRAVEAGAICAEHRCVRLFFASLEDPLPTFTVVVDLQALEVVEVVPMPGFEETN